MNYFLDNPQPQKPMSDEDLMALALQNKKNTKTQRKKKKMKGCGCCPIDQPEKTQRYSHENGLRKDFNTWQH